MQYNFRNPWDLIWSRLGWLYLYVMKCIPAPSSSVLPLACRIILESAYSLHDRVFFDNLFTVLLYAVIVSNISYFDNFLLEHRI